MKTKVFYELWQMECCGKPFKLGDNIEWYVISADRLVDDLVIDGLEYVYDAHFDDWDGILKIKGVVSSISVYYEKYEPISDSAHNMLKPVPGISEMISIDSSEEVEKQRGELQASGYIVDLEEVSVNPCRGPEVRDAEIEDASRILEIYDHYVKNTAITFEYETPSLNDFVARMEKTMKRYPYLVVTVDGRIEGYAYAGVFKDRAAYDWSAETTIYIAPDARRSGLGRMLYEALEERLKAMGILNMYACIGYPDVEDEYLTRNSAEFHEHLGFSKVGEFHKCGYKFGRWYNMIWMEKMIGEHRSDM